MPVKTEIDEKRNLVIHSFSVSVSIESILQTITNTANNPKYRAGMNAVWICEEGTKVEMSSEDTLQVSKFAREAFDKSGMRYKLALVANDDLAFGMNRMYEGWSNDRPMQIHNFRKLDDAIAWIEG